MTGRLKLWHGNIVDLDVDAVVNAAYRVPADLGAGCGFGHIAIPHAGRYRDQARGN